MTAGIPLTKALAKEKAKGEVEVKWAPISGDDPIGPTVIFNFQPKLHKDFKPSQSIVIS